MSQYRLGTIKMINGDATVEGTGTSWSGEIDISDLFKAKDEDVIYQVASVTNNTNLELSTPYSGITRSGELYQINRDFTPNLNLPLISAGDIDWPAFLNNAITLIDARINQSLLTSSSPTYVGVTLSGLTASLPVFTNASKALVSNPMTGTGSVVMSISPALVTPALGTPSSGVLSNCTAGTEGAKGVLALATTAEVVTGTDTAKAVTAAGVQAKIASSISDGDTTHAPDGNSVFDALALKAPLASPTFTTQITTPVVYGSSAADGDITIEGTSSATKTTSYVILQPTTGNVSIGTTANAWDGKLEVHTATTNKTAFVVYSNSSNTVPLARIHQDGPAASGDALWIDNDGSGLSLDVVKGTSYFGGNVAVGTTDLDGTPAVGQLTVKGATADGSTLIFVGRDSAEANVITIDTDGDILNSAGVYGTISDEKVKDNIRDATAKLSDILKLKVRNFNLIGSDLKQIGLVAQEMETVFPGLVKSAPDMERVPDPDWKPSIKTRQVEEVSEVEKIKTEIVEVEGKYVRKTITTTVEKKTPLFDIFPLYDEEGNQIFDTIPGKPEVLDENGNVLEPVTPDVITPVLHRVPRTEEYTEDESDRPMILRPTGTVTKAIKQSVLIPILLKAVQELAAEVATLKKARK